MKLAAPTLCMVIMSAFVARGQPLPDFSGTWTMDASRSDAAAQGTPIGLVTVAIRQSLDEVRVETITDGKTQVARYLPAAMRPADPDGLTGTFRWDGSALVTRLVTHVNNQAVTVEESRRLNTEGTEMTVEVTLVVEHGYQSGGRSVVESSYPSNWAKGKNVFVKSR